MDGCEGMGDVLKEEGERDESYRPCSNNISSLSSIVKFE